MHLNNKPNIAVIGLGYVGLPLAIEFAKHFSVIGYDISPDRISQLSSGIDSTDEVSKHNLESSTIQYTNSLEAISSCNMYVVSVPTPIDKQKQPDLRPLLSVSKDIATILSKGDLVVYESTVYPGTTEDECVPILESLSNLEFNKDFFVGYSPERANPGDKNHQLNHIIKVVSGSTPEVATYVQNIYNKVVASGTHKTSSIKVAEAAKIIENTQRDINIALMNELSIIFNKLGIDSMEVIEAAATKWNFNKYFPGLVGGHCIGVDPYYLTHKAQAVGYHPEIILAGRRLNDSMGNYVAERTIKLMANNNINVVNAKILVLGLTFKENCPDLRNTKVMDIITSLKEFNTIVDVYDPVAAPEKALEYYNVELISNIPNNFYDAIVFTVPHNEIMELGANKIRAALKPNGILYDVKSALPVTMSNERL